MSFSQTQSHFGVFAVSRKQIDEMHLYCPELKQITLGCHTPHAFFPWKCALVFSNSCNDYDGGDDDKEEEDEAENNPNTAGVLASSLFT